MSLRPEVHLKLYFQKHKKIQTNDEYSRVNCQGEGPCIMKRRDHSISNGSHLSAYAENHACVPNALRRAGTGFARGAPDFSKRTILAGLVLFHVVFDFLAFSDGLPAQPFCP